MTDVTSGPSPLRLLRHEGFPVVACPWRRQDSAIQQVRDMRRYREHATPEMRERYLGVLHTMWGETEAFLEAFRDGSGAEAERQEEEACFKAVLAELRATGDLRSTLP